LLKARGYPDKASTHIGRISREVKKGRQEGTGGNSWEISRFESIADDIDSHLGFKSSSRYS